ncbi:CPBP family intramembrane glutamic endopeptidase [Halorarius litoreus]|uniref:CPBP family intramembrane glutamic endopeptidase n=1 Tax=Halorarius litoreus TaxID=2962676 RepID=UPI0020CC4506|nr:CPBP family intramembrane glutamic endopeptidase [Halorarius litoreus]
MTDWAAFAGIATAVTLLLLVLARVSAGYARLPTRDDVEWLSALPDDADHLDTTDAPRPRDQPAAMSTGLLLANVAFSHGLFLVVLVGGALVTQVPAEALGISVSTRELALGVGFGVLLSLVNTGAGAVAHRFGYAPSADLRSLMSPSSASGWVLLLGVILPLVAVFEEFLFRAVLVGAFATGFALSPWLLAAVSSVLFALGHGAQGTAGVVVTGSLGLVLAAGYVLTGSLLVVVVAHYLVNALEFVVYEGLGVEFAWQG